MPNGRRCVPAGSPWGKKFGYVRAVRIGDCIVVSGTTAIDVRGNIKCKGDIHGQAIVVLRKIKKILGELDSSIDQVFRTRVYTTDISKLNEIARAHQAFFKGKKVTNTTVQISALAHPELLVEIEVEAMVPK
ncbi:MAG TPA: Rid family hydrolase [Nitrososphaerales archaeon]|nr:Rid family hydrolase [Nitrososphaerales archaeon]